MIRSKLLQSLTKKAREIRKWQDWDIVAELEQRDGDPDPAIRIYYCGAVVDWDGTITEQNYTPSALLQGPSLSVGKHLVKIRILEPLYDYGVRVVFGHYTASDTANPVCPQLKKVLKFDATKIRSMAYMFHRCFRLQKICQITGAENVTSVASAFMYCLNLEGDVKINSLKSCTTAGNFAYWCEKVKNIEVSGGGMPLCQSFAGVARYCTSIKKIRLGKCPAVTSLSYFAGGCGELNECDIFGFGNAVTRIDYMYMGCAKMSGEIALPDMPLLTEATQAFRNSGFSKITIGKTPLATAWTYVFYGCEKLKELSLKDASGAVNASYMLDYCTSLEKVDLGGMGPAITTLQEFAQNTTSLKQKIVFPHLEECTNMSAAFRMSGIAEFEAGDCPQLDNMNTAFQGCQYLKKITFGNCPAVTNTYNAFNLCEALEIVKINAADGTLNYVSSTFAGCFSLKKIDGKFKLRADGPSNASYFNQIFQNCFSLKEIPDVFPDDGWTAFRVANSQFSNVFGSCFSLVGTMPDLWTSGQPMYFKGTGSKSNCFTQCFNLLNYNEIPVAWRSNIVIGE